MTPCRSPCTFCKIKLKSLWVNSKLEMKPIWIYDNLGLHFVTSCRSLPHQYGSKKYAKVHWMSHLIEHLHKLKKSSWHIYCFSKASNCSTNHLHFLIFYILLKYFKNHTNLIIGLCFHLMLHILNIKSRH